MSEQIDRDLNNLSLLVAAEMWKRRKRMEKIRINGKLFSSMVGSLPSKLSGIIGLITLQLENSHSEIFKIFSKTFENLLQTEVFTSVY